MFDVYLWGGFKKEKKHGDELKTHGWVSIWFSLHDKQNSSWSNFHLLLQGKFNLNL
eukprot:m.67503 g.67503  ORF g.67503 m.67503 type:complete len:56 (-) comp11894_c0_seq1:203-370(-)